MKTNLLLNQPNNTLNCRQNSITCQTAFNGTNPLLNNKQKIDEFELENNLDTKEGQIAFLQYHLNKAKGSQGFIARGFNKLKGWTGLGLSSKKLDAELAAFMNDQVPFEKVCQDINKFKYNQKEATDILVDTVGAAVTFTLSHAGTNFGNAASCLFKTKKLSGAMPILTGTIFGSSFKSITKWIDSFGIEKSQRKENRHFFRDMLTGGIAGASGALPGVVGTQPIPMIGSFMGGMALNSGVRYLALDKEDKSFGDFCRQQLENPGVKLFATAGLATLAACNYKNLSEWEKVSKKCQGRVKDAELYNPQDLKTSFETLAGKEGLNIFNTEKENSLGNILQNCATKKQDAYQTLKTLENANMFYPKYLQTLPNNFAETPEGADLCAKFSILPKVIELVKSECTGARSEEEAQKHINELFGENKYTIIKPKDKDGKEIEAKPLGVGSVAETWLVKDKADKEYVVKMVKPAITIENLHKQKEFLNNILTNSNNDKQQIDSQQKALEQLFTTWEKELDLKAESEAATLLSKNVKEAKVVKPIETSKDGSAYVMEKAPGQMFSNFLNYEKLRHDMGCPSFFDNMLGILDFISTYSKVYLEQVLRVPFIGEKVMHADPHPGNIFVSINKDGKPEFTFIDTGNVVRMSNKEAVKNTFNHLNYFIGNTEAIATNLLKNAKYPDGMDEKQAKSQLKKYLDENFYDEKHFIESGGVMAIFNIVDTLALKWMQDNRVISDPTQANVHKAEYTYISSLKSLTSGGLNPLKQVSKIIKNDDNKLLEDTEFNSETKQKLIPIYKQTYENIVNDIKNINKIINEDSKSEWKKTEILLKKYSQALYILTSLNICGFNIEKLKKELDTQVSEVMKKIKTYYGTIKDDKMKTYLNDFYNCYCDIFNKLKNKEINTIQNEIKDEECFDSKTGEKFNNDTLTEIQKLNRVIEIIDSDFNLPFNLIQDEKDKLKQELNDIEKNQPEVKTNMVDDDNNEKIMQIQKDFIKSTFNLVCSMAKSASSSVVHPCSSTSELIQINKYMNNNKERTLNILKLTLFGNKQVDYI